MTLTVYRDQAGEWRWSLQARNGRIIATSGEGYRLTWSMATRLFPDARLVIED